jgi:hypothetical protein
MGGQEERFGRFFASSRLKAQSKYEGKKMAANKDKTV